MNISLPSTNRTLCMISTVVFFAACNKDTGPVAILTGSITPENQTEGEEISGDFWAIRHMDLMIKALLLFIFHQMKMQHVLM